MSALTDQIDQLAGKGLTVETFNANENSKVDFNSKAQLWIFWIK